MFHTNTHYCNIFFIFTLGVAKDGANDVKSRHHMLSHFSDINIPGSLSRIVAGVTSLLVVTLVTDPHGSMPVSTGHAFRL